MSTERTHQAWHRRFRSLGIKLMRLLLAALLLGWLYGWAAPMVYRQGANPGFWLGSVHGALMPAALPTLLLGKNVPIYAENNQGRIYKLGYIAGINLCGFLFFGLSFWQPGPRSNRERNS